jgi:hypothetical protein
MWKEAAVIHFKGFSWILPAVTEGTSKKLSQDSPEVAKLL